MIFIQMFFAGLFFTNGLPHFIKGITGQTHMTPFKRVSNSYLNIIWAYVNFSVGLMLLGFYDLGIKSWAMFVGSFFMAMMCAQLFSNPNAKFPWHKD
jgi:hypothetical protein